MFDQLSRDTKLHSYIFTNIVVIPTSYELWVVEGEYDSESQETGERRLGLDGLLIVFVVWRLWSAGAYCGETHTFGVWSPHKQLEWEEGDLKTDREADQNASSNLQKCGVSFLS